MNDKSDTAVVDVRQPRRLITVVPASAIKQVRETAEIDSAGYAKLGERFGSLTKGILRGFYGPVFSKIAVEAATALLAAWEKARRAGLSIEAVSDEDTVSLGFTPGHPNYGVVYAVHPASKEIYYPVADFHRVVFEHKFAEAVRLLMSLGATSLEVEHISGWSRDFSANLTVPLASGTAGLNAKAESTATSGRSILFSASLNGNVTPTVPEATKWLQHEPTWQGIAEGRLRYGLLNFSLSVVYNDDFGINTALAAKIGKAGLDVGGKFQGHEATTWHIKGTFSEGFADHSQRATASIREDIPSKPRGLMSRLR